MIRIATRGAFLAVLFTVGCDLEISTLPDGSDAAIAELEEFMEENRDLAPVVALRGDVDDLDDIGPYWTCFDGVSDRAFYHFPDARVIRRSVVLEASYEGIMTTTPTARFSTEESLVFSAPWVGDARFDCGTYFLTRPLFLLAYGGPYDIPLEEGFEAAERNVAEYGLRVLKTSSDLGAEPRESGRSETRVLP